MSERDNKKAVPSINLGALVRAAGLSRPVQPASPTVAQKVAPRVAAGTPADASTGVTARPSPSPMPAGFRVPTPIRTLRAPASAVVAKPQPTPVVSVSGTEDAGPLAAEIVGAPAQKEAVMPVSASPAAGYFARYAQVSQSPVDLDDEEGSFDADDEDGDGSVAPSVSYNVPRVPVAASRAEARAPVAPVVRSKPKAPSLAAIMKVAGGKTDDHDDDGPGVPGARRSLRMSMPDQTETAELETVVGEVTMVRQVSGEWAFGDLRLPNGATVRITGMPVVALNVRQTYEVTGRKETSSKYGDSIAALSATPSVSRDFRSMAQFLERNFKGIGPVKAQKYLDHVLQAQGEEGLSELARKAQECPWEIKFEGFKGVEYQGVNEYLVQDHVRRAFALKVGGIPGVNSTTIARLSVEMLHSVMDGGRDKPKIDAQAGGELVEKCLGEFLKNPYSLIKSVEGFGFATADRVGLANGIDRESEFRMAAVAGFASQQWCESTGGTYLLQAEFEQAISELDPSIDAKKAIGLAESAGQVIVEDHDGERLYYSPTLFLAEESLAMQIEAISNGARPLMSVSPSRLDDLRERVQEMAKAKLPAFKEGLTSSQLDAVVGLLTTDKGVKVLSGGPGTGKSTLLQVLVLAVAAKNKSVRFATPTGKAAQVVTTKMRQIGMLDEASTIHSMLMGSGPGDFEYNLRNKMSTDVLVIDESSMVDVEIAASVLEAVEKGSHVIFVGDPDQLPSVGPGRVLADLMAMPGVVHHERLTETMRNGGPLLELINKVRHGQYEAMDAPEIGIEHSHGLGAADKAFDKVLDRYLADINRFGVENVAFLTGARQGRADTPGWNITYANARAQARMNPHGQPIPGTDLREGDRVLIRKNLKVDVTGSDQETRVVNGDTGIIQGVNRDSANGALKSVKIALDSGRLIDFPQDELHKLNLGYAMTVHSSQGSEYKQVILVAPYASDVFSNRGMLFTAESRSKGGLMVFAEDKTLERMAQVVAPTRNSGLIDRVMSRFQDVDTAADFDNGTQDRSDCPRG